MTTVSNFFYLNDPSQKWVKNVEKTSEFKKVKRRIQQELKGRKVPPQFYELLIRELTAPLGKDVGDMLVKAWSKRPEISEYRNREKYPSQAGYIVTLIDHSFASNHTHIIHPVVFNTRLPGLKFLVVLKLNLKGVALKIRDAKIDEIRAGSFTGSGEIKYKGVKLVEKETGSMKIPLTIEFDPPKPI